MSWISAQSGDRFLRPDFSDQVFINLVPSRVKSHQTFIQSPFIKRMQDGGVGASYKVFELFD